MFIKKTREFPFSFPLLKYLCSPIKVYREVQNVLLTKLFKNGAKKVMSWKVMLKR